MLQSQQAQKDQIVPKLETINLRVQNIDAQKRFYCNHLGMKDMGNNVVGYSRTEAHIRFLQADEAYQPQPNDLYWKIAISVPDILLACKQLTKKGIKVTQPMQFQDVGYLAHFTDPEGLAIELIDHHFLDPTKSPEPTKTPATIIEQEQLGGGAHLSLITLRAHDMEPIHSLCQTLGMKPLSVQPVQSHGFTLYFFGLTDETPPNADLTAIENRPWLYQRTFTSLEIQHIHHLDRVNQPHAKDAGYAGISLSDMGQNPASKAAIENDLLISIKSDE